MRKMFSEKQIERLALDGLANNPTEVYPEVVALVNAGIEEGDIQAGGLPLYLHTVACTHSGASHTFYVINFNPTEITFDNAGALILNTSLYAYSDYGTPSYVNGKIPYFQFASGVGIRCVSQSWNGSAMSWSALVTISAIASDTVTEWDGTFPS